MPTISNAQTPPSFGGKQLGFWDHFGFFSEHNKYKVQQIKHHVLQEVENRWQERRAENAVPGKRVLASQMDISIFKQQEFYCDKFEEMEWFPIDSFIKKVAGQEVLDSLSTMKRKLQYVQSECSQKVVWDCGAPGVTVKTHDDGRKKVMMGSRTGMTKKQDMSTEGSDSSGIQSLYSQWQTGMRNQFSGLQSIEDVSRQLDPGFIEDRTSKRICDMWTCSVQYS